MKTRDILKEIRRNADDISRAQTNFLLSVDFDDYYQPHLPRKFTSQYCNFVDRTRGAFQLVHIWHAHNRRGHHLASDQLNRTQTYEAEAYTPRIPHTSIRAGEHVLAKENFSAFDKTDLDRHIPKGANVFVMGAFGSAIPKSCHLTNTRSRKETQQCIDHTLRDGLALGFNMIAIYDLIYVRYARRRYNNGERARTAHSQSILTALSQ